MKKYDELTKEEKKQAKQDFKRSAFNKYLMISDFSLFAYLLIFALELFTGFLEKLSIIGSIVVLIIIIAINEFEHYKRNELIKEYYELTHK